MLPMKNAGNKRDEKISCCYSSLFSGSTKRGGRVPLFSSCWYEIPDKPIFLLIIFGIQVAEDTEDNSTDQIDQQILHGVSDPDI